MYYRLEDPGHSHLVVFENRGELNCLIKYLMDEYPHQVDRYLVPHICMYCASYQEDDGHCSVAGRAGAPGAIGDLPHA